MSIVKCYKIKEPRSASEQRQVDSSGSATIRAEIDEIYYVETSTDTATQVAVRQAVDPNTGVSIPASGVPHSENPYLFAMGFQIREIGSSGRRWLVTVSYQSPNAYASPADEPPDISWDNQTWTAPIDTDKDGKAIHNAAYDGYDPPITREFSDWTFSISRNVLTFNTAFWSPYLNAINIDTFRGFPPYTCKVNKIQAQYRIRGSQTYFRLGVTIGIRNYVRKGQDGVKKQLGWIKCVLNQGYYKLGKAADGNWYTYEIHDVYGNSASKPFYLTADGTSEILDPSKTDQINVREHRVFDELKFADMEYACPGITG